MEVDGGPVRNNSCLATACACLATACACILCPFGLLLGCVQQILICATCSCVTTSVTDHHGTRLVFCNEAEETQFPEFYEELWDELLFTPMELHHDITVPPTWWP